MQDQLFIFANILVITFSLETQNCEYYKWYNYGLTLYLLKGIIIYRVECQNPIAG